MSWEREVRKGRSVGSNGDLGVEEVAAGVLLQQP